MKKYALIISAILLPLMLLVALLSVEKPNKNLEAATVSAILQGYSAAEGKVDAAIGDHEFSASSDALLAALEIDRWEKVSFPGTEELKLQVSLGDGHELIVYETYVEICDEYSGPQQRGHEYYTIPAEALAAIDAYCQSVIGAQ